MAAADLVVVMPTGSAPDELHLHAQLAKRRTGAVPPPGHATFDLDVVPLDDPAEVVTVTVGELARRGMRAYRVTSRRQAPASGAATGKTRGARR